MDQGFAGIKVRLSLADANTAFFIATEFYPAPAGSLLPFTCYTERAWKLETSLGDSGFQDRVRNEGKRDYAVTFLSQ